MSFEALVVGVRTLRLSYALLMSTALNFPPDETRPLSDIGAGAGPVLKEVALSGRPTQLIEDGKRVAVVMSPQLYDELCAALARLDLLTALDEGIADIEAGRTVPNSIVRARLDS